jgi:hypothetical protein
VRSLETVVDVESRDTHEASCLALGLETVTKDLSVDLRDLCERLKFQSVGEIARETGVPRTTLNYAISQLRERFQKAGLNGYLGSR